MAKEETQLQNFKINRGTYAKILENIESIGDNELIITTDKTIPTPLSSDNGKILKVVGEDYSLVDDTSVKGVTINGSSIVSSGTAVIPLISTSAFGVAKVQDGYGISASNGAIYIQRANESELTAKTQSYKPITPANLNIAIREGLGNNTLTWSDAYKAAARTTIGAQGAIEIEVLE